jgi:hypothetical protein
MGRVPAFADQPQMERLLPSERRKRVRSRVHWPLCLFVNEEEGPIATFTQDLSSGGFYCLTDRPFRVGETLTCLLKVPTYVPDGRYVEQWLECRVRVMRVESLDESGYGIAYRIEDYHFAIVG